MNRYLLFPCPQRENKKGQLEVTLLYTSSEDGLNDVIQLTINRLRCSVQTMQEQEQFKGEIFYYIVRSYDRETRVISPFQIIWKPLSFYYC